MTRKSKFQIPYFLKDIPKLEKLISGYESTITEVKYYRDLAATTNMPVHGADAKTWQRSIDVFEFKIEGLKNRISDIRKSSIPESSEKLEIGRKVYFEDENGGHNGTIHYIPTEKEQEFYKEVEGEHCVSIKFSKTKNPKFIPISMIILK